MDFSAKNLLKHTVEGIYPLDDASFDALWQEFRPVTVKRKICLTATGEVEKYLYFVLDGVQRLYYFDEQLREATLIFSYKGNFGGVLDSMMMQQPSKFYYETLSQSQLLRASYQQIEALLPQHPSIEILLRKGLTGAFAGVIERLVELQCYTAEERFRQLLKRSPHILQLVPHKYLANYIGIDASNFSKLMNKVKI